MAKVCFHCISDTYLQRSLPTHQGRCSYCSGKGEVTSVDLVAKECDRVLDIHFETTHHSDAVMLYGRNPAGKNLRDTLANMYFVESVPDGVTYLFQAPAEKIDQLLDDVAQAIESLWCADQQYPKHSSPHDTEHPHFRLRSDMGGMINRDWLKMHDSLQHKARFLNPGAMKLLSRVFDGISEEMTSDGQPVVVQAGPGFPLNRLYRARVFQSEQPLIDALEHPARLLGTPAKGTGPAGRMNARGQPAFYGATSEEVAIAEVRPPVGAWVATAVFEIMRPVKLLDFRLLARVQLQQGHSLFDGASIEKAQRRDFLRTLVDQLTLPVMPDVQERDYLVTQVIADFLATKEDDPLDGIIYPSIQASQGDQAHEYNVVLFSDASQVKGAGGLPLGSVSLKAEEEDGPGQYLSPALFPRDPTDDEIKTFFEDTTDDAMATLRVAADSIRVAKTRGVLITTDPGKYLDVKQITKGRTGL